MCRWKQRPRMRCGGGDDEPTALHIYYQMVLSFNSHLCLSRVCFSLEIRLMFFFPLWFRLVPIFFIFRVGFIFGLSTLVVSSRAHFRSQLSVYTREWDTMVRQFIAFIWRISEDAMWLHRIEYLIQVPNWLAFNGHPAYQFRLNVSLDWLWYGFCFRCFWCCSFHRRFLFILNST